MPQSPEHNLIFNAVVSALVSIAPELTQKQKLAIAYQIALQIRGLVRVKERDE